MKARSIAMGILLTYVSSASQPLVQDRVDYDMDVSVKTFSFKGSHNSYDQGHFIPEQVDGFNVWSVELDLCGVSWDYYVEVKHGCTDTPRGYLFQYLAELLDSHGWRGVSRYPAAGHTCPQLHVTLRPQGRHQH